MPRFSLKGLADKSGLNTNVDTNPILRYLAMVTPFVLEVILIWVAGTLSIWHLLLAVGLAVAFLILVGPFFFQEFSATSPFTFGHVAGAIFIHLILYYKYIVPATEDYFLLHVIFTLWMIPYCYSFVASHLAPSGHYQGPTITRQNIVSAIESNLNCATFCVTCLVRRNQCHMSNDNLLSCSTLSPSDRSIVQCVTNVARDSTIIALG